MNFIVHMVLVLLLWARIDCNKQSKYVIDIKTDQELTNLNHFWESTGFCPPLPHSNASAFMLSDDMVQNLMLISSVPHAGIKQVRIHWLLELIKKVNSFYNFEKLDELVDLLHSLGLKPGFEIMGNPSGFFNNFDDINQIAEFKFLVTLIAKRYIEIHGLEYVSSWNFETWNEPDHKDFDNVTMSVEGFLKYYDACSEGLKAASRSLTLGGPGGACLDTSYSQRCWALLEHAVNGTNYITGERGNRLDYISFHKKGKGKAGIILDEELQTISQIQQKYPELSSVPLFNDEADPLVGWSKPQWWRADATYAAVIAKVISQHQNMIIANESRRDTNYALLSNDNGFLSYSPHYFTQRTLNARFQINNTNPRYVHLVRKPSLVVMGLLSKCGDLQLKMNATVDTIGGISSICTAESCASPELTTLLYNSADTEPILGKTSSVRLRYKNISSLHKKSLWYGNVTLENAKAVACSLNNLDANPYKVWQSFKEPDFPTPGQLLQLHEAGEPSCADPVDILVNENDVYTADFTLPLPGVLLHHICWKTFDIPKKPIGLRTLRITHGQVLLVWKDTAMTSKCIKSYSVQFASSEEPSAFTTLNTYKVVFNSFTYITTTGTDIKGWFRVQAIDFWNRKGQFSDVVKYGF